MNNHNISKYLYKIFLGYAKYIPIIVSILYILNIICQYLKTTVTILIYLGGVSFVFITLLYLISFVFQFCYLYRLPLHYVTLGNIIGIIDQYFTIPISNIMLFRIYFIMFGIMLIAYIWLMYKNRNNPKVDPIKQLCETYCDCNCD
jgi:hypothetical protein